MFAVVNGELADQGKTLGLRVGSAAQWLRIGRDVATATAVLGPAILVASFVLRRFGLWTPTELHPSVELLGTGCVLTPVYEETIYRLALCAGVVSSLGPRWSVALSGVAFAAYHLVIRTAAPENAVGGFVLAWVYLRSETVLAPIAVHVVVNVAVVALNVAGWM